MKKAALPLIAFLFSSAVIAQTDYSGSYGYSMKPAGSPPKTEADRGPAGTLVLVKMEGNKYRFWLDVTLGWPTYHVGETDGTIYMVNDTASYDNTYENASTPCIIKFRYTDHAIHISNVSASYNCGFGNGVKAEGDYAFLKTQPDLNNAWLKKEYGQAPPAVIIADKAEIFQDGDCLHPFSPPKYFTKGDAILSIAESDKAIYTEYFLGPGKFVYGWIRKSNIKTGN
jgi:hypothetical protein